jgi:Uma2 family endonuclease
MQTLTKPVSYQEFLDMEFEEYELKEYIFELIDGEIMKRNYPTASHQKALLKLSMIFQNYLDKKKIGEIYIAPFGVILDDFNVPQPDLIFVNSAKANIIKEEGIFGVPDLLVEIISPSSMKMDKFDKFKTYQKFGVAEYWLIDPKNESIEIYTLQEQKYELFSFGIEKGNLQSKILTELALEVSEIF